MEELQVRPGDVLASKYRVEKVLGAGGMGIVVAARHIALGNLVAVKLMQPRAIGVKGAVERFLREGQAAAQLHSKHVAKVIDVGQLDSGAPYMVMEHMSGSDLASVIEKKGAVPIADAAEYLLQACDAIGEAHSKGIVHRDLKPANLFLQFEPDGAPLVKVLDFGIAKVSGSDQGLTGTSQGMGSGGYMSPEQMSSAKKVDHRADIWALGVTLYELITANRPFEADSLEQFVTRVIWEQPTPVTTHRADVPRELEAIILRCLEKQPDARFSSVAHFAQTIAPYAPPRAHVYVGRIAKLLGVEAPNLAQTNPGMAQPGSGTTSASTAFGPAPAVAVAAPGAPASQVPPHAAMAGTQPGSSNAVASTSDWVSRPGQSGAYPPGNASGPYPPAASQQALAASQQPLAASSPGPFTASQPGGAALASGPYAAVDSRVLVPPTAPLPPQGWAPGPGQGGQTDLTGVGLPATSAKKPPVALFALGGVLLVALGAGGVWLATRPSASTAGPPEGPAAAVTSALVPPAVTTADPPKQDAPGGSTPVDAPGAAVSGAAVASGTPSGKALAGAKPVTSAKAGATGKPVDPVAAGGASAGVKVPPKDPVGATPSDKRN